MIRAHILSELILKRDSFRAARVFLGTSRVLFLGGSLFNTLSRFPYFFFAGGVGISRETREERAHDHSLTHSLSLSLSVILHEYYAACKICTSRN